MPINLLNNPNGLGGDSAVGEQRGDYLNSVDPSKLLDDPRFHDDLREYYAMNGKRFENKDDMIRQWYDDRTYAELNVTFGTSGDVLDTYNSNLQERELKKRLVGAYQKMPFFFQDGGMGDKDGFQVAKSIGKAILTDPLNLIGPIAAAGKVGQAARLAAQAGKNTTWAATKAGAKSGAIAEAKYGAPIEAIADSAIQARDMQLGLQDEFSLGQTAVAAGAGGALSGLLGGVGGGVMGAVRGNKLARGLQEEDIANTVQNRPDIEGPQQPAPALTDDLGANEVIIENEQQTTQDRNEMEAERQFNATESPTLDEEEIPIARPDIIDVNAINVRYNETAEVLRRANADGDPDEIADAKASHTRSAKLRGLATRISNENTEIQALLNSGVEGENNLGTARDINLQEVIGWYEQLKGEDAYSPRSEELFGDIVKKFAESREATTKANTAEASTQGEQTTTQPQPPGQNETDVQAVDIESDQPPMTPNVPEPTPVAPVAVAPTQAPDSAIALDQIFFDDAVEMPSGEVVTTPNQQASVMYKGITDRVDRLQKFKICIGG